VYDSQRDDEWLSMTVNVMMSGCVWQSGRNDAALQLLELCLEHNKARCILCYSLHLFIVTTALVLKLRRKQIA